MRSWFAAVAVLQPLLSLHHTVPHELVSLSVVSRPGPIHGENEWPESVKASRGLPLVLCLDGHPASKR